MPSTAFTGTYQSVKLPVGGSVTAVRSQFPNAKVMVAIGGWGDTSGFSLGATDNTTITTFASNIAKMLKETGADGVGEYLAVFHEYRYS
jgi:GH18 family chitinase